MHIGNKIKSLRVSRGLTQKQLAGHDMTREFISLIENGHSQPSLETIRIISEKLSVSPDYFLAEDDSSESVMDLLRFAQECLREDMSKQALHSATKALAIASERNDTAHVRSAYDLIAKAYEQLGDMFKAIDAWEVALHMSDVMAERITVCKYLFCLGNCHFRLENYRVATRYYTRIMTLAEGLKSIQDTLTGSMLYLGSCYYRMGDLLSAKEFFSRGLTRAKMTHSIRLEIDASLSLGWILHKLDDLAGAIRLTEHTVQMSRTSEGHLLPQLQLNLGILYAQQGRWESAIHLWHECLERFTERDEWNLVASTLEEICGYHLHYNQVDEAQKTLSRALDILDGHENRLLKGRIFRVLAGLSARTEAYGQAVEYFKLSIFYFRSVGADDEIRITEMARDSAIGV